MAVKRIGVGNWKVDAEYRIPHSDKLDKTSFEVWDEKTVILTFYIPYFKEEINILVDKKDLRKVFDKIFSEAKEK